MVKPLRIPVQMPFSDECGIVSRFLQHLGKGGLVAIKLVAVHSKTINMTVLSCKNYGAARPTDGIRTEIIHKNSTFLCDTVNIGCRCQFANGMSISTNGLGSMVISHDINNVRSLLWMRFGSNFRFGLARLKSDKDQ